MDVNLTLPSIRHCNAQFSLIETKLFSLSSSTPLILNYFSIRGQGTHLLVYFYSENWTQVSLVSSVSMSTFAILWLSLFHVGRLLRFSGVVVVVFFIVFYSIPLTLSPSTPLSFTLITLMVAFFYIFSASCLVLTQIGIFMWPSVSFFLLSRCVITVCFQHTTISQSQLFVVHPLVCRFVCTIYFLFSLSFSCRRSLSFHVVCDFFFCFVSSFTSIYNNDCDVLFQMHENTFLYGEIDCFLISLLFSLVFFTLPL